MATWPEENARCWILRVKLPPTWMGRSATWLVTSMTPPVMVWRTTSLTTTSKLQTVLNGRIQSNESVPHPLESVPETTWAAGVAPLSNVGVRGGPMGWSPRHW